MAGNSTSETRTNSRQCHYEDSDIDLSVFELDDKEEEDSGYGCGHGCSAGCGCPAVCMGRVNLSSMETESASVYPRHGGAGAGAGTGRATPALPMSTLRHQTLDFLQLGAPSFFLNPDEYDDDDGDNDNDDDDDKMLDMEPANHSWKAPLPTGDLTRFNIARFNREAGDGRADFLRQHEIDVDARPDLYFLSSELVENGVVVGPEAANRMREGLYGGMEDSVNVNLGNDLINISGSEARSRSSRHCLSSLVASTCSISAILPDMRISLVYQPLLLVPEYHGSSII